MANDSDLFDETPGRQQLHWEDRDRFRRMFTARALRSYAYLSFGMGVVALSLPLLLLLAGQYSLHYSISHYYHAPGDGGYCRNVFVGCLWSTGVFLILFQGFSNTENWILNVGGVAAIGVTMFPTAESQTGCGGSITLHASLAITFFLCLAVVAIVYSKERIRFIIYPPKKRFFERAYNIAGGAMILLPGAVVVHNFLPQLMPGFVRDCEHRTHWIFWAECFAIWAFSAYWFVKAYEYRLLLGVRLFGRSRSGPQAGR